MSRVFITGDTHAGIDIEKLHPFNKEHPELTKDDYLIVLGDFGVIWNSLDEYTYDLINTYEGFNFSTAFVLGNHEGYDLLKTFPKEEWRGGLVRRISDSIVQLENGEIYNIPINNKDLSFFVMGGALSIDKDFRRPGLEWWKDEIPNLSVRNKSIQNLLNFVLTNKFLPDFFLTHTPPADVIDDLFPNSYKIEEYSQWLNYFLTLKDKCEVEWYCGHMHMDKTIDNPYIKKFKDDTFAVKKLRIFYNNILEIMPL